MAKRLMDEAREAFRANHYSYRTEEQYLKWMRRFILFHDKRHPRVLGLMEGKHWLMASLLYGSGLRLIANTRRPPWSGAGGTCFRRASMCSFV